MRRCSGYVANIRLATEGRDAILPYSAQVAIKIARVDPTTSQWRFVFARTAAYTIAFPPRSISPCSFAHISMGDLAPGVIEFAHATQVSTNFEACDSPGVTLLERLRGPQMPSWRKIVV